MRCARECVGTPFQWHGRKIGEGMDCIGPLVYVADKCRLQKKDCKDYGRTPARSKRTLKTYLESVGFTVSEQGLPGSVVLVGPKGKAAHHAAILTGEGTVVHTREQIGRVVEAPLTDQESQMVQGYMDFPGVG